MGSGINFARQLGDSLTNLVSRMGPDRVKAGSSYYGVPLLDDQDLLNAYRSAWLPRKTGDIRPSIRLYGTDQTFYAKPGSQTKL